jgi:hypothetical protein
MGRKSFDLTPPIRPVAFFFLAMLLLYIVLVVTRDILGFHCRAYFGNLEYEVMQCCGQLSAIQDWVDATNYMLMVISLNGNRVSITRAAV